MVTEVEEGALGGFRACGLDMETADDEEPVVGAFFFYAGDGLGGDDEGQGAVFGKQLLAAGEQQGVG